MEATSRYKSRFVKIRLGISDIGNSLSDCSKSMKKICVVDDFRTNVLNKLAFMGIEKPLQSNFGNPSTAG